MMLTFTPFDKAMDEVDKQDWEVLTDLRSVDELPEFDTHPWRTDLGYSDEEKADALAEVVSSSPATCTSLREWTVRLWALLHVNAISPLSAQRFVTSAIEAGFFESIYYIRQETFGDELSGELGRRLTHLIDARELVAPAHEIDSGDESNLREILGALGCSSDVESLCGQVTITIAGDANSDCRHRTVVANVLAGAADLFTWLFLLDFSDPHAEPILRAVAHDDLEEAIEQALIEEYDQYASRFSLSIGAWEHRQQEAISFLHRISRPAIGEPHGQ